MPFFPANMFYQLKKNNSSCTVAKEAIVPGTIARHTKLVIASGSSLKRFRKYVHPPAQPIVSAVAATYRNRNNVAFFSSEIQLKNKINQINE